MGVRGRVKPKEGSGSEQAEDSAVDGSRRASHQARSRSRASTFIGVESGRGRSYLRVVRSGRYDGGGLGGCIGSGFSERAVFRMAASWDAWEMKRAPGQSREQGCWPDRRVRRERSQEEEEGKARLLRRRGERSGQRGDGVEGETAGKGRCGRRVGGSVGRAGLEEGNSEF